MSTDATQSRSRRALLVATLGAAGASVAATLAQPLGAVAADDESVVVGGEYIATSVTKFDTGATGETALWGNSDVNWGVRGTHTSGYGGGVLGQSSSSPGVLGVSVTGTGVRGYAGSALDTTPLPGPIGVYGSVDGFSGGVGVRGAVGGLCTGVRGESESGVGGSFVSSNVDLPASPPKTGVHGYAAQDATAVGVKGESPAGTGVLATTTTGTALRVAGKAKFSRSGRATVLKGKYYVDITVAGGLAANSMVHATLQTYRSGVAIAAVRRNYPVAGKARIYLTKVASSTSSTYLGWFVAEY